MMTSRTGRWALALLAISLGANVFFAGFASTAALAMSDPETAIRDRIEKVIDGLPDKDRNMVEDKYDAFLDKYEPLIDEAKMERKAFARTLLTSPVDMKQAKAQAEKLRGLTTQLQEGMQETLIDIASNLPEEEKKNIVKNSRMLRKVTN